MIVKRKKSDYKKLLKKKYAAELRLDNAMDAVFKMALHGHEKLGEVLARIGDCDKSKEFFSAQEQRDSVRRECADIYGPEAPYMYDTYLTRDCGDYSIPSYYEWKELQAQGFRL